MAILAVSSDVECFFRDLVTLAPPAGEGTYAFRNETGGWRGFIQFIPRGDRSLIIHRLWTREPGAGNGSAMLRAVCALADRHGVEITLKPLPIGRTPYPLSREQLHAWYERHGFIGTRRKLIRRPRSATAGDLR